MLQRFWNTEMEEWQFWCIYTLCSIAVYCGLSLSLIAALDWRQHAQKHAEQERCIAEAETETETIQTEHTKHIQLSANH